MVFQIIATFIMLGFFGVLMEEPWRDWRNGELGGFGLFFFFAIFASVTSLAVAVIWT